ncbi:hypothetical protein CMMCAS05_00465 [Clavibacter michiganensis subsp. michiganensis]|nr:hypothetical protein CMMCAS05_00465 [Clavibacter michiganensis subsp. michiganensis]
MVDVVEDALLVGLREGRDVDAREVAAAERAVVGGEVAQEVDLLERRTQALGALLEADPLGPRRGVADQEGAQAHQADDLGGSVHVLREGRGRVLHPPQVHAHGREERRGQLGAETCAAGGDRERVHDEVGAVAAQHRVLGLLLQRVEQLLDVRRIHAGTRRGAVDDLVGHAHERVHVLDVLADVGAEEARREPEGGGVAADHDGGRLLGHAVVLLEARGRLGGGGPAAGQATRHRMRPSTDSATGASSRRSASGTTGSSRRATAATARSRATPSA